MNQRRIAPLYIKQVRRAVIRSFSNAAIVGGLREGQKYLGSEHMELQMTRNQSHLVRVKGQYLNKSQQSPKKAKALASEMTCQ